ncbi:type II restriction enzyme methylase subunit [Mycobacteroides abscessus subsp. abscessus]|nr:type II restriction enzyme methylase subunit [Mycobacteroides abscessus subsp. abscessus]
MRPDWDEAAVLADFDPWWQLAHKPSEAAKREKLMAALESASARTTFLNERTKQAGQNEHLGSGVDRPVLIGLQPDSYRCFGRYGADSSREPFHRGESREIPP